MSRTVEWIEPIDNRTYGDVLDAETIRELKNPIGAYNPIDLNRIENNTIYVMEEMLEREIIKSPPVLISKLDWKMEDIATREDVIRIIQNVKVLMELSNPDIAEELSNIYDSAQMSYQLANAIEKNLVIMKDQPEIPLTVYFISLTDGIILETGESSGYFAGDMLLHIQAVAPTPDAGCKIFTNWSGNKDDLQYLENNEAKETILETQHHDMYFTANFKVEMLRTLSVGANVILDRELDYEYTNSDYNGSLSMYRALVQPGELVEATYDLTSTSKRFHKWSAVSPLTEADYSSNIIGTDNAGKIKFIMPNDDVHLDFIDVYAGPHTVKKGIPESNVGDYFYGDYVSMSADLAEGRTFLRWALSTTIGGSPADTKSPTDVSSLSEPNLSFTMGDGDVTCFQNWIYPHTPTYKITVENGHIKTGGNVGYSGESFTIEADVPRGYVFDKWVIGDNEDRISTDNPYTGTFSADWSYVAHFKEAMTVRITNLENNGETKELQYAIGSKVSIYTTTYLEDSVFSKFEVEGTTYTLKSSANAPTYWRRSFCEFTAPSNDVYINVVYRPLENITMVVNNGTHSEEYVIRERDFIYMHADEIEGKAFHDWTISAPGIDTTAVLGSDKYDISYQLKVNTMDDSLVGKNPRITATANYVDGGIMSIINGTAIAIDGKPCQPTNIVKASATSRITVVPNDPPVGETFSMWEFTGSLGHTHGFSTYEFTVSMSDTTEIEAKFDAREYCDVVLTDCYILECSGFYYLATDSVYRVQKYSKLVVAPIYPLDTTNKYYTFVRFTDGADMLSTAEEYYIERLEKNMTISAVFDYSSTKTHTLTLINGHFGTYLSGQVPQTINSKRVKNNSYFSSIYMNDLPLYMRFVKWNIVTGPTNAIYSNEYSESPTIRMTGDTTIEAVWELGDPSMTFTCIIHKTDGQIQTYSYPYGEEFDILADDPDEGWEFYRWEGDTYCLDDRYSDCPTVTMPADNVELHMTYVPKDYVVKWHVILYEAELLNEKGEWTFEGEFPRGTVVQIRPKTAPYGWRFNKWAGSTQSMRTVEDLYAAETTLTVEDFDIELTREIIELDKYTLTVENGEVSGAYYENDEVAVYYNMEDTEYVKYRFVQWSGSTDLLTLKSGEPFDITKAGTPDDPQVIVMPAQSLTITAEYDMTHKLQVVNGSNSGLYFKGDTIAIYAIIPDEQSIDTFMRWTGDTDKLILADGTPFNINNPGTAEEPQIVVMPDESVTIIAEYNVPFNLTVINGEGSGEYMAGMSVPVTFVAPEDAYRPTFAGWTGDVERTNVRRWFSI